MRNLPKIFIVRNQPFLVETIIYLPCTPANSQARSHLPVHPVLERFMLAHFNPSPAQRHVLQNRSRWFSHLRDLATCDTVSFHPLILPSKILQLSQLTSTYWGHPVVPQAGATLVQEKIFKPVQTLRAIQRVESQLSFSRRNRHCFNSFNEVDLVSIEFVDYCSQFQ